MSEKWLLAFSIVLVILGLCSFYDGLTQAAMKKQLAVQERRITAIQSRLEALENKDNSGAAKLLIALRNRNTLLDQIHRMLYEIQHEPILANGENYTGPTAAATFSDINLSSKSFQTPMGGVAADFGDLCPLSERMESDYETTQTSE